MSSILYLTHCVLVAPSNIQTHIVTTKITLTNVQNNPWSNTFAETTDVDQGWMGWFICFCKWSFIGIQQCLFTYKLPMAAFTYETKVEQLQKRLFGLQSLKYLPSGLLQKKFANPCPLGYFHLNTYYCLKLNKSKIKIFLRRQHSLLLTLYFC